MRISYRCLLCLLTRPARRDARDSLRAGDLHRHPSPVALEGFWPCPIIVKNSTRRRPRDPVMALVQPPAGPQPRVPLW